jgi:hypothetical protein
MAPGRAWENPSDAQKLAIVLTVRWNSHLVFLWGTFFTAFLFCF